ncbi:LPS export ABC transporter periplasmic protein LptC [Inmirania thermothiophila]|uniref:Lipopolysaccharide export system protein LptC n=1 Tax=Inmirania thermothiophila TaxID=1750597 RepID=A0A3N1XUA6_9GAMM|nr:LPS export ABC transporter periplasmic protein LptC [Inmirania thermothiophila]ROR29761.1 lipopolysaccharide export system protein LptC [Inmirania thermothiophila]
MKRRAAAAFLGATALAAALLGLVRRQEGAAPPLPGPAHVADWWVSEGEAVGFDEAGAPRRRLRARRMVHYRDDGTTELDAPRVALVDAAGTRWRAEAERGRLSADRQRLRLEGAARLERLAPPARLDTRDLLLELDRERAATDAEVDFAAPGRRIRGRGLRAELAGAGRITLLAEVRGRHEPTP